MTKRTQIHRYVQLSKKKTGKIGTCSINDIIKTYDMTFKQKVDYIRHHYTYYDGNYPMFHNRAGEPNYYKRQLNGIICAVILKKKDPGAITEFNKKIMAWRAKHPERYQEEVVEPLDVPAYCVLPTTRWQRDIQNNLDTCKEFIEIIQAYIKSGCCKYTESELRTVSYKEIKKVATEWNMIHNKIKEGK